MSCDVLARASQECLKRKQFRRVLKSQENSRVDAFDASLSLSFCLDDLDGPSCQGAVPRCTHSPGQGSGSTVGAVAVAKPGSHKKKMDEHGQVLPRHPLSTLEL